MKPFVSAFLSFLLILSIASSAPAGLIVTSIDWFIQVDAAAGDGDPPGQHDDASSTVSGPFEVHLYVDAYDDDPDGVANANANLLSSITHNGSLLITAEGDVSAFAEGNFAGAFAETFLTIDFTITDTPMNYQIDVNLEDSSTYLSSSSPGSAFYFDDEFASQSGLLEPGNYHYDITATAFAGFGDYADFDVEFAVQPVPIPATIYLLGVGFAGISGLRRKLKK